MVLLHLLETIRLARDLAPIIRVFAAGLKHANSWLFQQWNWAKEALKRASGVAEKEGVILALHNHAPIMHSYRKVLEMIEEVGSPALKACIDPHCLWWADEPMEKAFDCGPLSFIPTKTSDPFFPPGIFNQGWTVHRLEFCPLGQEKWITGPVVP
jgi:sugar phosphate isomerase/epimerase